MPRDVECQALLELADVLELAAAARVLELVERLVGALHVGSVMGAVVQLDELARQVRLERVVAVRQFGQRVHRAGAR